MGKRIIIILVFFGLLLPSFSFVLAQNQLTEAPETLEGVKEMGEKAFETAQKELPGILERIWKEEVLPFWQKMYSWGKNIWDSYLWPKIGSWIGKEIEKRKPIIQEEFEKEKEEIKKEVPEIGKSLWERFKDLIK